MNKIVINNGFNSGSVISVNNGEIIIDGETITNYSEKNVKVIIEGNVGAINCSGSVEVHGNSEKIESLGGKVAGSVQGKQHTL